MWFAERRHVQLARVGVHRGEHDLTVRDGLVIGLVQCFSLIPGVSRSGATISAGLLRGLDRVTATELSFFMAIPALTAAGVFQAVEQRDALDALGAGPIWVGIIVAFVVAYASIAWLLRFVANHSIMAFVWYRVARCRARDRPRHRRPQRDLSRLGSQPDLSRPEPARPEPPQSQPDLRNPR